MMTIQLDGGKLAFVPGERVQGTVSWELESAPRRVELRLFWYTSGRGSRDVGIVETRQLQPAARMGPTRFDFLLPGGPYSFSGKLIALTWAIELVAGPYSRAERIEFLMAPGSKNILLQPATIGAAG